MGEKVPYEPRHVEFQEYMIAAWIQIDRLDYEMNAILNSDELHDGAEKNQTTGAK